MTSELHARTAGPLARTAGEHAGTGRRPRGNCRSACGERPVTHVRTAGSHLRTAGSQATAAGSARGNRRFARACTRRLRIAALRQTLVDGPVRCRVTRGVLRRKNTADHSRLCRLRGWNGQEHQRTKKERALQHEDLRRPHGSLIRSALQTTPCLHWAT